MRSEMELVETGQNAMVVINPETMTKVIQSIRSKEKEFFREGYEWIRIGKGKHLTIEGWTTLGNFFGLSAKTKILEEKYDDNGLVIRIKASATIVRCDTGLEVSSAEQIATTVGMKVKMGGRYIEDHEVFGMAQTRASSRAYGNFLRGIARKLGFQSAPAEEITDKSKGGKQVTAPAQTSTVGQRWKVLQDRAKEAKIEIWTALKKAGIKEITPKNIDDVEKIIDSEINSLANGEKKSDNKPE